LLTEVIISYIVLCLCCQVCGILKFTFTSCVLTDICPVYFYTW